MTSTTLPGPAAVLVVHEADLRRHVPLTLDAVEAVGVGFSRLAAGEVAVPPIMIIEVPDRHGEVDVKSAYVRGWDAFAVKIASGFFDNAQAGLPNSSGLMVAISAVTGFPLAVLLDNGYLTDVRTAAAGALAARHLARREVRTVGIVGAGVQARFQLRALRLVRSFERALVFARRADAVQAYVDEMSAELDVPVEGSALPDLVRASDLVVTTTPSREPLVQADWLHPGLHITAMGSDSPGKRELHPEVISRADLIVCDAKAQCVRLGELQHAADRSPDAMARVRELGELTSGRERGRTSDAEITVCDLTGVGVQDSAITRFALHRLQANV